jgi:hypothetical protein
MNTQACPRRGLHARRLWTDVRGAAAVEFALVLPLLLALLFGIVEFSRAWNRMAVMSDAAREGARRAVVRDGAEKGTAVSNIIQSRLANAGLTWNGALTGDETAPCPDGWPGAMPGGGDVVVVGCGWGLDTGTQAGVLIRAPYPFNILRPVVRLLDSNSSIGPSMLTTSYVMRNE